MKSGRSLLRQPLLHFLLGALAIFAIDALRSEPQKENSIIVSEADIARLASGWELAWGAPPTRQEIDGLVDDWITEEVYVRQAEALGLGEGDPLIRKYLRRKMELLTEGVVIVPEPSEEELRAYYRAHVDKFSSDPLVSFRQAVRARESDADYAALVDALNRGAAPETLEVVAAGEMQAADRFQVSRKYGVSFYDELVGLTPGSWQGPVASSIGVHLVKVEEIRQADPVPFEQVKPQVQAAWRAEARETLEREAFERLKNFYSISVEAAPE